VGVGKPALTTGGDALLLLADGVRVDGRRRELGVSQPLLHHVQRDANAAQSASPTVAVTPQAGGVTQAMYYVVSADKEAVTPQVADLQVVPTTPLPPLR
jgi:hypothetical protein